MLLYRKTIQDIPHGLYTLRQAADMPMVPILAQEMVHRFPDTQTEINASEIQTLLIQLTGRFCEHYASDLLCTLTDSIRSYPYTDSRTRMTAGSSASVCETAESTAIRSCSAA